MRLLRKGLRKNTRNDNLSSPVIARSEATWQSHTDKRKYGIASEEIKEEYSQ
ncbi:hypothetical protein KAW96_01115 [candidate division WOR-3 bacterium]|nr:hypothetical protein [candidate division WOR-3 bacterium]